MFGRKRRRRHQMDLSAELHAHLAIEMDRLRAEGLTEEDAYRMAHLNLGNLSAVGETFYESARWLWLEHLLADTRLAIRRLRKTPVFAITTILTLALGIGATTSIFTLVHAVLLKSLPVSNPADLYRLGKKSRCCYSGGYTQEGEFSLVSYDLYRYLRDHTRGFAALAAFEAAQPSFGVRRVSRADPAQSYPGEFVSGNYFEMFGVKAYAGRALVPSDDQTSAPPAAVMSYRVWQERFGLDPSVIGSVFTLNDKPFTVVGIAPPRFFGDSLRSTPPDFFLPLSTEPLVDGDTADLPTPNNHWLNLIGRIQPGANPAAIQAQMRVELQQWLRSHWGEMDANDRANLPKQTLYLTPGGAGITSLRQQYEHWLQILMMVTAAVLLIVCANVANLMLVRGMERRPQISLSMALGARSSRLIRQALTESVALSLIGGAAGLAVAFLSTRLILHSAFSSFSGLGSVPISAAPSAPVLLFAFAISLLTGTLFGIAPAWMAARVDPIEALRGANRSTNRTGGMPRKTLVMLQAALSLALLSASGLLTGTLRHLENQDFGFDQDHRIIVSINPLLAGYKLEQLTPLYTRIRDSVSSLPGVAAVGLCTYSPLSGDFWGDSIFIAGRPAPGPHDDTFSGRDRVTGGFFEALGNPIIHGRGISARDTSGSRHVAVINEAFARKFFGHESPLGKHFGRDFTASGDFEIVGVAKNARFATFDLDRPVAAFYFVPEPQYTAIPKKDSTHYLKNIVIEMSPGATLSDAEARRAIAAVDLNMPVTNVQSLRDQVASQFVQPQLIARLTSLFGILSLVLASIGLYGVTAYNAGCRTSEIGLRMALGANRSGVIALVLQGAAALVFFGLLIGAPLTIMAGRFLGSQLYGMSPFNPFVMLAAASALAASALVAALIPAIRASFISPLAALRAE